MNSEEPDKRRLSEGVCGYPLSSGRLVSNTPDRGRRLGVSRRMANLSER